MRGHRKLVLALVLVFLVTAPNAVAYRHARALTRYSDGGTRTEKPEDLSLAGKIEALLLGANVPRPANAVTPAALGLPFETVALSSSGGAELEAWRVPCDESRGLVLLFHGYAASKSQELEAARFFHEKGYEAFLVDFRGSGGSSGRETTLGVREADDVASALAVVLEQPFGRMLDTVRARFDPMPVPSFPAAQLLVFWGGFQQGFDGFSHNPVDYAKSVRCPALVLVGEKDPTISLEQERELVGSLAGPKTLATFPAIGHVHLISARPDEWKAAVSAFLH
ncbi:hypothetical protein HY251_10150 [bacterium]|nr:hypothetical protein [bacterium]